MTLPQYSVGSMLDEWMLSQCYQHPLYYGNMDTLHIAIVAQLLLCRGFSYTGTGMATPRLELVVEDKPTELS